MIPAMSGTFDVLVAGAGPAGIAAAVRAAESGARVALIDDNPAPGGQIWRSGAALPGAARTWLARLERSSITRLHGWRIFDKPAPGSLRAEQQGSGKCSDIGYKRLILATGARERFLPFPGWTLPGVMGAGGLDAMVRGGLPIAGRRVVVAGTGPLLLAVAAHLAEAGAHLVAVCEQASLRRLLPFALQAARQPGKTGQAIGMLLAARRAKIHTRCWVLSARGPGQLQFVTLRQPGHIWDVACDYLACGFHLVPNLELPLLFGCRVENGFVAVDVYQRTSMPEIFCAGEPTGIGGVERALLEGQIAGLAATDHLAEAEKLSRTRKASDAFVRALAAATVLNPELRGLPTDATLVCRCEDVSFGALREHTSWRGAKLHTRCGMGPCQGRICGAATEFLFGWPADSVRPPILPARLSSLAAISAPQADPLISATQFNNRKEAQ
jgi:NADPH-dependent 2,4-dienoyl-CoA reductase/sulfur reductase-like enzyme